VPGSARATVSNNRPSVWPSTWPPAQLTLRLYPRSAATAPLEVQRPPPPERGNQSVEEEMHTPPIQVRGPTMLKANVGISRKMSKDLQLPRLHDQPRRRDPGLPGRRRGRHRTRSGSSTPWRRRPWNGRSPRAQSTDAVSQSGRRPSARPLRTLQWASRPESGPSLAGPQRHPGEAQASNGESATQQADPVPAHPRQAASGCRAPKLEVVHLRGRRAWLLPYDLSKKEAGAVIDALNPEAADNNRPRR